jgi:hypothetical protein
MATTFEVKKGFELTKKLTVDGKEYESLDQVPAELRGALEQALASGAPAKTTISVNGKTVASIDDLPPWLRAIVRNLAEAATQGASGEASAVSDSANALPAGAVAPEPIVGVKALVILVVLAAILFWLVRSTL